MDSILGYSQNFTIGPLGQAISIKKWHSGFFSKLIFTKCQLTIIIKIHKLLHIHSFYYLFITNQVAQRQSGELVSQGSQVLISLMTIFFFSQKSFWRSILKIVKMKKKIEKKNLKKKFWKKNFEKKKSRFFLKIWKKWSLKLIFNMEENTCSAICREKP